MLIILLKRTQPISLFIVSLRTIIIILLLFYYYFIITLFTTPKFCLDISLYDLFRVGSLFTKKMKWKGNDSLDPVHGARHVVYGTTRGLLFVLIDNERRNKERRATTRAHVHCAHQRAPSGDVIIKGEILFAIEINAR